MDVDVKWGRISRLAHCPFFLPVRFISADLLRYEPGFNLLAFQLQVFGLDTPEQVEEDRDQTGPPRLMAGAEPRAVVTVEVFMEEDQIAPVRIVLKLGGPSVNRPPAALSRRKVLDSRREISWATSNSVMYGPEPVGH